MVRRLRSRSIILSGVAEYPFFEKPLNQRLDCATRLMNRRSQCLFGRALSTSVQVTLLRRRLNVFSGKSSRSIERHLLTIRINIQRSQSIIAASTSLFLFDVGVAARALLPVFMLGSALLVYELCKVRRISPQTNHAGVGATCHAPDARSIGVHVLQGRAAPNG